MIINVDLYCINREFKKNITQEDVVSLNCVQIIYRLPETAKPIDLILRLIEVTFYTIIGRKEIQIKINILIKMFKNIKTIWVIILYKNSKYLHIV